MAGSIGKVWQWYSRKLDTSPMLTKMSTSSVMFAGGDVLCQTLEGSTSSNNTGIDVQRTLRMSAMGFVFGGILHHWYQLINRVVPPDSSPLLWLPAVSRFQPSTRRAIKQVAIDQTIFAPFATTFFIVGLGSLEGKSPEHIRRSIVTQGPKMLLANYSVWPAAIFINFRFVPLEKRVLFSNTIALGYNGIVSYLYHK